MRKTGYILVVFIVLLTVFGCYDTDMSEAERESVTFDLEGIKPLELDIEFAIGKLEIETGTGKLTEAKFAWNNDSLKPEYSMTTSDDGYRMTLSHVGGNSSMKKAYSEWEVLLNEDVPLDLTVECGVGESTIDLSRANLRSLFMDLGIGDTSIDMNGSYHEDIVAEINTGIGEVDIKLPSHVGLRVEVDRGLGEVGIEGLHQTEDGVYENDLYHEDVTKIEIEMSTGIGTVDIDATPEEVAL